MFSTQLNDAHFIVLASFVSREEMTVDKQLSEAFPLADDIKPGY